MPDDPAARLGKLARAATEPRPGDEALDRQLEARLVQELAGRRESAPWWPRAWVAGVGASAAVAVVLALVLWTRGAAPLSWSVEGAEASQSGYVRADVAEATVAFADGTRCVLSPRTVVRIEDVGEHGARLLVEDGRLDGRFAHRPGARWSILAGPFTVTITGTDVGVAWSAVGDELDVQLRQGSVEVRGPHAEAGVPLAAGQRLRASPSRGEIDIRPLHEGSASTSVSPATPVTPPAIPSAVPGEAAAGAAPSGEAVAGPGSAEPGGARPASWSQRVGTGDFAGVVADAEARGVDGVLSGAGAADLAALADAARYTNRGVLARRALLATRARFGGSSQARTAAFLLGLLADARSPSEAASWYATYLAEAPSGAYAAEALGRQMLALRRGSAASARPIAERYLVRYPNGPHAPVARELVAAP
ncbi:MAG: FecR domain-containing protein [Polyangiaceae bacterium]